MVAYTDPDCIPYFEGGDSVCLNTGTPCDPSTVWCDQAEVIEAKLDFFDSVVARTATSVPLAWVETTTPFTFTNGIAELHVDFTTVRVDTDNMVNLDVESDGFLINTAGLYNIWGFATGTTSTSFGVGQSIEGSYGLDVTGMPAIYGLPTITEVDNRFEVFVNDVRVAINFAITLPITAGARLRVTITGSGITNDQVTYSKVSLGATWVGDLP